MTPAPGPVSFGCMVRAMKAFIFGIFGAVAALIFWGFAVTTHGAQAEWISVSIYAVAAAGFIVGWVVGFAISKIKPD